MKYKKSLDKILFEISEKEEDKTVYQRKISTKGRSAKELNKIVKNLPTATIHSYSLEEYNTLKEIEKNLYERSESEQHRNSLKEMIKSFLEI